MKKEIRQVEVVAPTKEINKLLSDTLNNTLSDEDKKAANDTLYYYAGREIYADYALLKATILKKTNKGYAIEVPIQKVGGIGK